MSIIKRIYTLLCAILVGLIASICIIQSNPQIENFITKKLLIRLENMWGIKIDVKSSRINFFTFSVYVGDGHIIDYKRKNCHWKFKQCKIHISPIELVLHKKIELHLTFDSVEATTCCASDNKPEIADHIAAMFESGIDGFKIEPKIIQINNIKIDVIKDSYVLGLNIQGWIRAKKFNSIRTNSYSWHAKFSVVNAEIKLNERLIAGNVLLDGNFYKKISSNDWDAQITGQIKNLTCIPQKIFNVYGESRVGKRQIDVSSLDKALKLTAVNASNATNIHGVFKLSDFIKVLNYCPNIPNNISEMSNFSGDCRINLDLDTDLLRPKEKSSLVIENLSYKNAKCEKVEFNLINSSPTKLISKMNATICEGFDFGGICNLDLKGKTVDCKITNSSAIKPFKHAFVKHRFGDYSVDAQRFIFEAKVNSNLEVNGLYKFTLCNQNNDNDWLFQGKYNFKNSELNLDGSEDFGKYKFKLQTSPSLHFSEVAYKKGDVCLSFKTQTKDDYILNGKMDYTFIKSFLSLSTRNLFLGHDCVFNIAIDQRNLTKLSGAVELISGRFYVPESQNLIQKIKSDFEFVPPNKLCLNNARILCFKGDIFSPKITAFFDKNFGIDYLHIPLQINDLLVNYRGDLLGIIYGGILIKKDLYSGFKALGQIVIKKSLLKENVFAAAGNGNFYSRWGDFLPSCKDFEFDFKFFSEQPIKAKTQAIETNANLNLHVCYKKNSNSIINVPQLTGNIKLDGGFLKFWQNKLHIDYGKIEFVANQMNDPIIDLIAKNRINKYMVCLQASGSLQKPTILVESTPELTEEQVLSLLLSGSENYKLQTDLLAMLEIYLYNSIFGSNAKASHSTKLLQKITRTMKYIQISPDFTDQSGRGGIKGTINVNINDQAKAQLQKNFNLQDDFSVQLEYMLSDDVNVRCIKDQRGELGAEVELKVKF